MTFTSMMILTCMIKFDFEVAGHGLTVVQTLILYIILNWKNG